MIINYNRGMSLWTKIFRRKDKNYKIEPYRKFWRHPCAVPISGGGRILNLSPEGAQLFLPQKTAPAGIIQFCAPQLSLLSLRAKIVWSAPYKNGYLTGVILKPPTMKIYSYLTLLSRLDRMLHAGLN